MLLMLLLGSHGKRIHSKVHRKLVGAVVLLLVLLGSCSGGATAITTTPTITTTKKQQQQPALLLLPCEIVWDSTARVALAGLRQRPLSLQQPLGDVEDDSYLSLTALRSCVARTPSRMFLAVLTLIGYKGTGLSLADETNQDRALVAVYDDDDGDDGTIDDASSSSYTVSGVLDGHGTLGHLVAEWSRHQLLQRLPAALRPEENATTTVVQALSDMVEMIDRDLPDANAVQGGATLSLVLQRQGKLYFINAGDSQSFLVAAITTPKTSTIESSRDDDETQLVQQLLLDVRVVFSTRLHKPDDPDERVRLEAAGMTVKGSSIKNGGDDDDEDEARVWYTCPREGHRYGLAMSRALGDRDAVAVIAQPTITTLVVDTIVDESVQAYNDRDDDCVVESVINLDGSTTTSNPPTFSRKKKRLKTGISRDRVHLFVVSATDGLLDYLSLDAIAFQLAQALYENKEHVVTAAESLLHQSSAKWQVEYRGQYRDDMTIAVAQIS